MKMGRVYELQGNFDAALLCNQRVSVILKIHPNTTIKIQNLNNQGIAHRELDNFATALTCFQQALALQSPSDNKRGRTLKQIGETYLAMQQSDTARAYLLRGKVFRDAEYGNLPHPDMAKLFVLLGDADHQQNNFQGALAWYIKAENRLRLASPKNNPPSQSRSILNSMWQVRDGSSAFLMEAFYRGLRAGKPLDVALQQAMLAYLDSEDFGEAYMAPHFWAGFRITGAAAPLQQQRSNAVWWMLFGFVVTGLLYWRYQHSKAKKA